jgi:polyhydroxybutyrate depolymerase
MLPDHSTVSIWSNFSVVPFGLLIVLAGCGDEDGGSTYTSDTAGGVATGGVATGGVAPGGVAAGEAATGGTSGLATGGVGTGGRSATGGVVATGGDLGTGGVLAAGGDLGTGGVLAAGGDLGTGGDLGSGGDPATGGDSGTGGDLGTGGGGGGGDSQGCGAPSYPEPCTTSGTACSMDVDGTERAYFVLLPDGYDSSQPCPLVFQFHPMGGTAQGALNMPNIRSSFPDAI